MQIVDRNVYIGPNLYARFPVIRLKVHLGILEEWPSAKLGGPFIDGLLKALPGLHEHGCSYGVPGGFLRRLREDDGTWMGHIFEHLVLELQNVAGSHVTFGRTRGTGEKEGEYYVVYEYEEREVGLEAADLALRLIFAHLPENLVPEGASEEAFDWTREREGFIRFAQRRAFGPSTASLVKAAQDRGIPWMRLNRYSLVQFGHGRYQRRIQATITSETRHIAVEIASDKEDTNQLLGDLGLPVPRQRIVYSPEEASGAAQRIGYPVVVKPLNANHGRGVSINLEDAASVALAFEKAREHSRTVLVESFLAGFDHRMLVINGSLIAVSKRVPGHVVGDGKSTIGELVEEVNRDPRRGIGHEKVLTKIEFDYQAKRLMGQKNFTEKTVLPEGEVFYLRSTGNLSTGGTAVDLTDSVHPDNREMAERAARAIGLDVAGVDFISPDITQSYRDMGGGICEVNAAPGFRMHIAPSQGTPRDVAGPVMDMLFPPGSPSRVPIAAVTGTNGKTTTVRMLTHIFKMAGNRVGTATTDGVYIDGHKSVEGDMTGPMAANIVLRDPSVDVAVLECARGGLLRRGLGFRKSNVSACLNVAADHLGLSGVDTLEQLAEVKRIVVEVAQDTVVLNADDHLCLKMADHCDAKSICYVTLDPGHALVKEHIRAGGKALVLEAGINGHMITLYDSGVQSPLLWTVLIPATLEGKALHNVQNAMFAAGIAYNMGLKLEDIRHGLRTFATSYFQAPGRMNIFTEHAFTVILDYGHNPAAVKAMCALVERMEPRGRRICVLAAPGDRRDQDIRDMANQTAGRFDFYICRRDDKTRGRGPDEVPKMLQEALLQSGVNASQIEVIPDEQKAVRAALKMAREDDLLLLFGDNISRCWKQIKNFVPGSPQTTSTPAETAVTIEPGEFESFELAEGERLVRDERGVRLTQEASD